MASIWDMLFPGGGQAPQFGGQDPNAQLPVPFPGPQQAPWLPQTTPWPQDAAPLTAQQRYRAAQAGDESRMPTFQRTGPTLPGMIAQSMEDTGRMMTTAPPAMPKGAYMDAGGPAQGTADPQAFSDWLGEMRQRGELAPSMALGMIGGGTAFAPKAAAGTVGTSLSYPLFHGTDQVGLDVLKPSIRGPLGPGVYTSPAEGIAKMYRPAEGGAMYQLPEQARDIYLGHGHRTDAEWFGFKEDKQRLLAAAEPEKREAIGNILDKMWSGDGYPTYQRIAQLYGNEEAAQGLYKRAGFQGISGQVDGPEVLLFGDQSLKPAQAAPPAQPGIRAYHGSPHDFDQFDLSKIGTGEGAQAYGHGMYFAENEGVAKSYRDALDPKKRYLPQAVAAEMKAGTPTDQIWLKLSKDPTLRSRTPQEIDNAIEYVKNNPDLKPGKMYEVNIGAHPEHFLDWDKPLSQQHPQVQDALKQALGPNWEQFKSAKAGDAVKKGFIAPGEETTAAQLRQAGIPGIRYLDQGSRTAGEGSRNYVVFDPKAKSLIPSQSEMIELMRKYGIAGLLSSGAASQLPIPPQKAPVF